MKLGVVSVIPRAEISRRQKTNRQNKSAFKLSFAAATGRAHTGPEIHGVFGGEAVKFPAKPGILNSPRNVPGK